jgi:Transglutaminase-like superfamily
MARVAGWAVLLSLAIKLRSLTSALRLLSAQPRKKKDPDDVTNDEISTAVDAVLGLNVFVFRQVCWKRAILLHHFLGRQGHDTTIVFGIRKEPGGELKGHAWLEVDGRTVLEKDKPEYMVTYRFPSPENCNVDLTQLNSAL